MSFFLLKTTETYRCDSEEEANLLVASAKEENDIYDVTKSTIENRQLKQKGEIIDEWKRVTITKEFTSEKEPWRKMEASYSEQEERK